MSSVLVIGGGAVGTALAYRLATADADVTLLDTGAIGTGTTSATFSMTIAARKTPRAHFDLAVAGATEHRRLAEELGMSGGTDDWGHHVAAYEWATTEHDRDVITARVDRLQGWGYPVEWIDGSDLRRAEPHLAVDAGAVDRVAVYPHESWYDATRMAQTLAQAATRAGATLLPRQHVTAVTPHSAGVEVTTADGDAHTADRVVICSGPESEHVAALAGHSLPVRRVPGLVITSKAVPSGTLRGIVMLPQVNLRPAPNDQLMAHSYTTERDLPEHIDDALNSTWTRQVVDHATTLLPPFGETGIASTRVGVRPVPADGLPIAGWLDADARLYAVAAHSGVNLAPALAQLAAAEILNGTSSADLAPFRPGRASLVDPEADVMDESTREMTRIFTSSPAGSR